MLFFVSFSFWSWSYHKEMSSSPKVPPVDSAVIGGPQLASLAFLLHATDSHWIQGTLLGFFEVESAMTDHSEAAVHRKAVITGVSLLHGSASVPSALSTNTHQPIGEFSLRRRTAHRLTWKESTMVRTVPEMAPAQEEGGKAPQPVQLFFLMTDTDSEQGLQTTHYTLFSRGVVKEVPLTISNLVSTGGEYHTLLKSFTRAPATPSRAIAAHLCEAVEAASQAQMDVADESAKAVLAEMDDASGTSKVLWAAVQQNLDAIAQKRENIEALRRELEALEVQAQRPVARRTPGDSFDSFFNAEAEAEVPAAAAAAAPSPAEVSPPVATADEYEGEEDA
jgi:hypothetical protein